MPAPELSSFVVPGTDPDVVASYEALSSRALEESFGFEDEIAFVDIETTGFDRANDRIIEVAAVVARGPEVLERFSTLVDPGRPVPRETTHLTGIDDAMLAGAPPVGEAVARLVQVVGGRPVVAHNVGFDRSFLSVAAEEAGLAFEGSWLDSLHLARIALPRLRSHRLADLAQAFGLGAATHRAADDAEAVHRLWRVALCGLADLPAEVVTSLATLAPQVRWGVREVLSHLAAGRPSAGADLGELRRARVKRSRGTELADAGDVELDFPDREEVLGEFEAEGTVGRMYERYEPREEQKAMCEAVLDAFREGTHLAVEAGTGVGKSVAYLVPAARFACTNGVSVGVSTKTNTLMDQLVHSELPALARQWGDDLRFVGIKGFSHYPCLRKLDRYLAALDSARADQVADAGTLLAWTAQSSWGDADSLNVHWSAPLRQAVLASADECTRKRCRFFPDLCYVHGVRRRASCAHVVVTNHAYLFSSMAVGSGALRGVSHWIVDEAHSAEAVARDQLSAGIEYVTLRAALRGLVARRSGALQGVAASLDSLGDEALRQRGREAAEAIRGEADTALAIAESFFDHVKDLHTGGEDAEYDRSELRITTPLRESGEWARTASVGRSLARHLASLLDLGRVLTTVAEEGGLGPSDDRTDLSATLALVERQWTGLVTVLDGSDKAYVYSASVDRRRDVRAEVLRAQLLDVGEVLAEGFLEDARTVVFTSATIAAGDDFSHFERSVGLDRVAPERHAALRLPSSYDFERQMAAFVTADLAEPGEREYLSDMEDFLFDLHVAMGGSTLTLFTNQRDLARLFRALEERLEGEGLRLVAQHAGESTKRVRDEFVGDERASLFATKSFWQGFDAKGDTLRCVVVARLPFAHPGDPLLEELRERDPAMWWSRHYLPQAILELKQAAGRLIRSSTDRGCLVIADSRVAGPRSYGRRFLEALPVREVRVLPAARVVEEAGAAFGPDGG